MAFVYRADRKIELSGKENLTVGPGAYVGHKDYKPKPQVHMPFQSMTGREAAKSQQQQTQFNPGPGAYKADQGFDHISKSMQSAKNLSMYGLEKFGITVIKPSNCFASKVDRFQEKVIKEKSHTPGPGQYVNDQAWVKSKKQAPKPEWQQIAWNRMPNPPSIPSHDNVFGYEENPTGELVRQKNSEKVHTGVKADTVGPGEYEIAKALGAAKKGPAWHPPKNQKKTIGTEPSELEVPGPGHYNADKVDIFPIYKYKPSSVFVSKVVRDKHRASAAIPPKPQSSGNQSYNPMNTQGDDDYYDEDDDDGQTPGPGSYFNPKQSTTFKIKPVPERLQFFGSTVERFNQSISNTKLPPNVGPGSYQVAAQIAQKKMRNSNAPFLSTNQRFLIKEAQVVALMPGPGTYQAKTIVEELQKKPWGKQGVFGSTEKRFVQAQTLQTPGPGMYKPERSQNLLDNKNEANIKRSSSMFISHTKRNPYEHPKHLVPVVQYDDKTKTISEEVRQKVEAGVGNPLLANLKAKRGINAGFSSNAQRFPDKKMDEAETFLGPGYYEQQSTFESKQPVQVNNNKAMNFLSNAPRFGEHKNKVENPGPGQYSNEDLNNWFKRSYNMIFTE